MDWDQYPYLPNLATERTSLRKLTMDDAPDMFAYAKDPDVAKYTTWDVHETIENSKQYIEYVLKRYEDFRASDWGIVDRNSDRLIGTIGFVDWSFRHGRAEIGYALAKPYWNQGILTEVAREVIRYSFGVLSLHRMEAKAISQNIGSQRVMEKAGMVYEGTMREALFVKGARYDLKTYAILRTDYERSRI